MRWEIIRLELQGWVTCFEVVPGKWALARLWG